MKTMTKEDQEKISEIEKILNEIKNKYIDDRPITERVKTFEDALELVEVSDDLQIIIDYNCKKPQMLSTQAHAKLSIIAEALNEGWKPDWNDSSQTKHYPWMKYQEGVGFSYYGCVDAYAGSTVGSRLCFKSSELAEYAGKQFHDLYNEFLK